jgi:hypothetical protein
MEASPVAQTAMEALGMARLPEKYFNKNFNNKKYFDIPQGSAATRVPCRRSTRRMGSLF